MADRDIIDIEPLAHSTEKTGKKHADGFGGAQAPQGTRTSVDARSTQDEQTSTGYYTYRTGEWKKQPEPVYATDAAYRTSPEAAVGATEASAKPKSKVGAAAQIVAGGACTLVGIPMLILPGPGLLAIGGGIALMANGARKLIKQ